MFKAVDPSRQLRKGEHKAVMPPLNARLGELQRELREARIPVIIVFEGWEPTAMAFVINRVLLHLDPRGFTYHNISVPDHGEMEMPFMWRFWMRTPWKGQIAIFDRSWYSRAVTECLDEGKCKALPQDVIDGIVHFERLLSDDGTVMIKLFLHTSKREMVRPSHLSSTPEACGLVVEDLDAERLFRKNLPLLEEIMAMTDLPCCPWTVVESDDPDHAEVKVARTLIGRMEEALRPRPPRTLEKVEPSGTSPRLTADLTLSMPDEVYKEKLVKWQDSIREAQCRLFKTKWRLVVVFEGRDASGKGGAINRLAQALSPRTYHVIPTGVPDDMELSHHYLWRFQRRLPPPGHIAIFDRSWYGRVLVERVGSLVPEATWRRAYREINEFERILVDHRTIIVKLWLEVDMDTQLERFRERESDPQKTWKITPEDWKARERWDAYSEAIDEMLERTSTSHAPWTVIGSRDKNHSRIRTLKTIAQAVEKELD